MNDFVIHRTTAPQQIADALGEMVASGEIAPGEPLRESALAVRLGVSRNTVREAVRILEQRGLVRVEVGRGAVVRQFDADSIHELYGVREILELAAVRESRGVALDRIRAAIAGLDAAFNCGDESGVIAGDLGFHAAVVALLGNDRLDRFFADLCGELRFFLAVVSRADQEMERANELLAQHSAVLSALEAGNRRTAGSLLREHIRANEKRAISLLSAI